MIVSEIIREGLREGNLIPIARDPTTAEVAEALGRLNTLVKALYGFELGELLQDWPVPSKQRTAAVSAQFPYAPPERDMPAQVTIYPPANVRIVAKLATDTTIWLPQRPDDGARVGFVDVGSSGFLTLDANGRLIEDATGIPAPDAIIDPPNVSQWFYRADLGTWQRILPLVLTDLSPFPDEFDDLLITGLCIRLSPRYGNEVRAGTASMYTDVLGKFKARYRQHPNVLGGNDVASSQQSFRKLVPGPHFNEPI